MLIKLTAGVNSSSMNIEIGYDEAQHINSDHVLVVSFKWRTFVVVKSTWDLDQWFQTSSVADSTKLFFNSFSNLRC
jgi:hypothetical protein